jgi:hypothetical protein
MTTNKKILIFFSLLIINHIFHTYELYKTGYLMGKSLFISNPILFLIVQSLLFLFLLFVGFQLIKNDIRYFTIARIIAFSFLFYGLLLAFGNIYKEEKVIGSFTGFFHVMITLPLVLWISDYLKEKKKT